MCFHDNVLIHMSDGTKKYAYNIKIGDIVATPTGSAHVTHILICNPNKEFVSFVHFTSGLSIMPYHPIHFGGKWIFPTSIAYPMAFRCDKLYNFVLDKDHIIIANDIECCTLGHNFKGDVIGHNYFGTNKIVEDINKINKHSDSYIHIDYDDFIRDSEYGHICGIKY